MKENEDLTLLVMAAGMGSRFGGLKQIEPMGPNDEFITDYSIYDAMRAGIKKVVFIIRKENLEIFQNTIEKRIGGKVEVDYAFQENVFSVDGKEYTREKPWGTAHAIFSAKDKIHGNFLVINSDDFYGKEAYLEAKDAFDHFTSMKDAALIGYLVKNTLTENGACKRGVCEIEDGSLKKITESSIEKINGEIIATPLIGGKPSKISIDTVVSMNMWAFTPYIFDLIQEYMKDFIESHKDSLDTCEYLIPDVIERSIEEKKIQMRAVLTNSKWEGVTYKEDKEGVKKAILEKIEKGEYPRSLWKNS